MTVYISPTEGKMILVNKSYERISGIKRSLLIGEYMQNLVEQGVISTSITKDVVESKRSITRTQTNANDKVIIAGTPYLMNRNVRYVSQPMSET